MQFSVIQSGHSLGWSYLVAEVLSIYYSTATAYKANKSFYHSVSESI